MEEFTITYKVTIDSDNIASKYPNYDFMYEDVQDFVYARAKSNEFASIKQYGYTMIVQSIDKIK